MIQNISIKELNQAIKDNKKSLLHEVIELEAVDILKLLLEKGCDPNIYVRFRINIL